MGLIVPCSGLSAIESTVTSTATESADFAEQLTSGTGLAKGSWTELFAATSYETFGVHILVGGVQGSGSTNQRALVDVGIGGSGSEVVLIPDLDCGNVSIYALASNVMASYYFPIRIPAGARLSARCAASVDSDNVNISLRLFQRPFGILPWFGSRVTAYGVDAGNCRGTSHSPGNGSYATPTQITASTTNPIRALQMAYDLLSDTTGSDARGLARIGIGATPTTLVGELPFKESTTVETVFFSDANAILAQMRFNLPAAIRLTISAMRNVAAEGRGWILYGVD